MTAGAVAHTADLKFCKYIDSDTRKGTSSTPIATH